MKRMDVIASIQHRPVMVQELLKLLLPQDPAVVVDCTLGGGGHARALLQAHPGIEVMIGFDRDPACIAAATAWGRPWAARFKPVHGDFRDLASHLRRLGYPRVDAILLDLGVSSYQLDTADRGFSFLRDGPLDMRMDPSQHETASALISRASVDDLCTVFRTLGEERWAARIARSIANVRTRTPITRTRALADVVAQAIPRGAWPTDIHPATRVFQALRMAVNRELEALSEVLPQALASLHPRGRLGVLAFHSLEDRQVKRFIQQEAKGCICPPRLPQCVCHRRPQLTLVTRKPCRPGAQEVQENPRSRSARLRVCEKLPEEA
jgi:16S rRNA (cytosine1402-N4)-methyltransferase